MHVHSCSVSMIKLKPGFCRVAPFCKIFKINTISHPVARMQVLCQKEFGYFKEPDSFICFSSMLLLWSTSEDICLIFLEMIYILLQTNSSVSVNRKNITIQNTFMSSMGKSFQAGWRAAKRIALMKSFVK